MQRALVALAAVGAAVAVGGASARPGFNINGYVVGTWRNVDNKHVYVISKAGAHYKFKAGASWTTGDGCPVSAGFRFYVLIPEQTTGTYLDGGDYHGDWSYIKKDDKGNCVTVNVAHGDKNYYEDATGFVPTSGAKTSENPDGQYLKWFCAYLHNYTQCGLLSRIGKGFVESEPKPKSTPKPTLRFSVAVKGKPTSGGGTLFPSFTGTRIAGSGTFAQRATYLEAALGAIVVEQDYFAIPDVRTTVEPTGEGSYIQGKGAYLRMHVKVTRSNFTGCSAGRTGQIILTDAASGADAVALALCGDRLLYKNGSPRGTVVKVSVSRF